ncbi:40S ribosomal protein S5-B [Mycena leptocephala]|nr:40S ribosomal protein S5-B [Mycena leptocephala]
MKGPNNDKKMLDVRIGAHTFEIIHLLTDQNLILQVCFVDAIVNTGSREDSNRIGSPGTVRWQAVDVSPLRRTRESSYCNVKSTAECLADKLIDVQRAHPPRMSLRCEKDKLECVAKSNR